MTCVGKDFDADVGYFASDVVGVGNNRAHPFVWTKTADEILKKANRQTTSNAGH